MEPSKIPTQLREQAIEALKQKFKTKYVNDIELGISTFAEEHCKIHLLFSKDFHINVYLERLNDIIFNCCSDNSTYGEIKKELDAKKINGKQIAYLKPHELDKKRWEKESKRIETNHEKINNLPTVKWQPCRTTTCGENKYFFYLLQTRSGDEPPTTFYTCTNCSRMYRING